MIMDKAAIFAEVTKRNALRRANFLPPLDVRAEYARQVSLAGEQDYRDVCNEHAAVREAIRKEILTELRAKHGMDFGYTMGGRWAVGDLVRRRFADHMAKAHRLSSPGTSPAKNMLIYGSGSTGAS